ncbi:MAG: hypothetical protein A2Z83_03825 [Omnitrophica bacterium GWA2_52_8]|nr:MAG: hypothetical protein A2Z83_03825 [Omnitrophica bacterium GWA2_52_8]
MRVILLCAGYATRLYPLTENHPKPLLAVGNKPILEWILDRITKISGVKGVYVVTNHKFSGHFEKWTKALKYPWAVEIIDDGTVSNDDRLGAIGDLNFVLQKKKISAEDLLIVAGDNFFDFDLEEFIRIARSHRPHGAIAVYDVKDKILASQYGLVRTAANGKILEFLEKPKNPPTTLASCGLYWLPAEIRVFLDRYLASGNNPDQPGHYMCWLSEQDSLFAIPLKGRWLDIGDRDSYDKANKLFREFQPQHTLEKEKK